MSFALKRVGGLKTSPTFQMLGYTPEDLRKHVERQFVNGMSWDNRHRWELDHIIPISSAKTVEDVVSLNQLPNLRPIWAEQNLEKRDKRLTLL